MVGFCSLLVGSVSKRTHNILHLPWPDRAVGGKREVEQAKAFMSGQHNSNCRTWLADRKTALLQVVVLVIIVTGVCGDLKHSTP